MFYTNFKKEVSALKMVGWENLANFKITKMLIE
jgi:hypothetical protein